jgi:hypothetical protein
MPTLAATVGRNDRSYTLCRLKYFALDLNPQHLGADGDAETFLTMILYYSIFFSVWHCALWPYIAFFT